MDQFLLQICQKERFKWVYKSLYKNNQIQGDLYCQKLSYFSDMKYFGLISLTRSVDNKYNAYI